MEDAATVAAPHHFSPDSSWRVTGGGGSARPAGVKRNIERRSRGRNVIATIRVWNDSLFVGMFMLFSEVRCDPRPLLGRDAVVPRADGADRVGWHGDGAGAIGGGERRPGGGRQSGTVLHSVGMAILGGERELNSISADGDRNGHRVGRYDNRVA